MKNAESTMAAFLQVLSNVNLYQVMVSFDVKSSFTNVSLQETFDLISDKIYANSLSFNQLPIKKKIFKKLLNLATKEKLKILIIF